MSFVARVWRCLGAAGLGVFLCGCLPSDESRLDEQKDPNYLAGKRRVESMDYPGAAECFERAIESNPRSASAHYELGILAYEKINDWAAAIYHFEKYLKLEPQSHRADTVKQLVAASKQEMVKELPLTSLNQRELTNVGKLVTENNELKQKLEPLSNENIGLKQQIEQLKAQLGQRTAVVAAASAPALVTASPSVTLRASTPAERSPTTSARDPNPTPTAVRTHTVRAGETPAAIARAYNVTLSSLLSVNPAMEPRRIRPGQTVNIPAR